MINLVLVQLKRRPFLQFVLFLAFVVIFVITPLSFVLLKNVENQVESDITFYSRGSYDLLVRAKENKHPLEKELGIVPENYIGFGEGGISIEEWESIKQHPDVEIAAPVASVGFFPGVLSNVSIEEQNHSTRNILQFFTTDGIHEYPISKEYACILLKSSTFDDGISPFEELVSDLDLLDFCTSKYAGFPLPATYHLLVGIDAEEEQKLTGIPFELNQSGYGAQLKYLMGYENATVVPILEIDHEGQSLIANLTIDTIDIDEKKTQSLREQMGLVNPGESGPSIFLQLFHTEGYPKLLAQLMELKATNRLELSVNLGSHLKAFEQEPITITTKGTVENMVLDGQGTLGLANYSLSSTYFKVGHLNYEWDGENWVIKKIGENGDVPLYRTIEKVSYDGEEYLEEEKRKEVKFITDPIGTVEIGEAVENLASSPLGIYQFAPVHYIDSKTGEKIKMKPTTTPGSFISPPAKGVTTIEAAAAIKGDRPIDAIRVRIKGIAGYTDEAREIIDRVAQDIEEMGLDATIVAGASPQKLKVKVEGIGLVEESWTTLGAAGSIVHLWNINNAILGVLFLFTSIIYILTRLLFWHVSRERDILLLANLGWQERHIYRLHRNEILLTILSAYIFSLPLVFWADRRLGLSTDLYITHLLCFCMTIIFIIFMVSWKTKKILGGQTRYRKGTKSFRNRFYHSFVIRNILYYFQFFRNQCLQLMIVGLLSSFIFFSIRETKNQTKITLLGDYINMQIQDWHILLLISIYILAFFSLAEALLSSLQVRKKEMELFQSIGWQRSHIVQLYMKELALWSGMSIAIGTIIGGLLLILFFPPSGEMVKFLILSFSILYGFTILYGYGIVRRFIKRSTKVL